jgi:hypothetical protein
MAHGGHWECISESVEGFVRDEIPGLIQDLSLFTQGPWPPGATPPEGVTPELTIKGRKMFRLLVTAGRLAEADIDPCLYAGAHKLPAGYVPKAGDDIGGKLWLQGHLVE